MRRYRGGPTGGALAMALCAGPVWGQGQGGLRGSESQPTVELSLEEAALQALRNNRDLQVQQLNPVIAGSFMLIERGIFDPELFAEGTVFQENASQVARATEEQFQVEGRSTDLRGGIRKRFSTGTQVEVSVGHQYDDSDRTPEQQAARVGLSVEQSLLRGLGPAVNLASVRQAELETKASTDELRAFIQSLLARTETAYWDFVRAREEIRIFERSLRVVRQEAQEVEERIEVGTLPELEAAPSRSQVARQEQALIDAQSRLEAARLQLIRLVNPDPSGSLDVGVVATSEPELKPQPLGPTEVRVELAEERRPELRESRYRLERNELEVMVTRNGLLPRLDFFASFGKTGFAPGAAQSFGNLDQPTYDVRAGLSLSHFLLNRSARGAHLQARATRAQSEAAIENLRQAIRLEVRLAVNEVNRARAQISASSTTRALQENTLEAAKARFQVGVGTSLLVAQARRDLLVSQIDEVRAVVDYRIALVHLYLAEGSLLERRGVTVDVPTRPDL